MEQQKTLDEVGEFGLIDILTKKFKTTKSTIKGIGDDCAVLELNKKEYQLITTDLLLEGIHFDLVYSPLGISQDVITVSYTDIEGNTKDNDFTIAYYYNGSLEAGKIENAGSYKAIATATNSLDNYYDFKNTTLMFNVAQIELDLSNFDIQQEFEYDSLPHSLAIPDSDLYSVTTTNSRTNVGTDTVKITLTDTTNYCLSNTANDYVEYDLIITKKDIDIYVKGIEIVYGDAAPDYADSISKIEGIAINDSAADIMDNLSYDCSYAQFDSVGEYDITVTCATLDNYNPSILYLDDNAGILTVTPKLATVTWSYTPSTYDGTKKGPTVELSGDVNDDTISYTLSNYENILAGDYTASISLTNNNYYINNNLTYVYTISKAPLEVTCLDQEITFGETIDDISQLDLSTILEIDGIVGDDSFELLANSCYLSSLYDLGDNVGTYAISVTLNNDYADNYSITYIDATLTVSKKNVDVYFDHTSTYTYNGFTQSLPTASFTDIYGNNVALQTKLMDTSDFNEFKNAGKYYLEVASTSTNYNFNAKNSNVYNIEQAEISIGLKPIDVTYSNSSYSSEVAIDETTFELPNGFSIIDFDFKAYLVDDVSKTSCDLLNAGDYTIELTSVTISDGTEPVNDNFDIDFIESSAFISTYSIYIQTSDEEFTYGDSGEFKSHEYNIVGDNALFSGHQIDTITLPSFNTPSNSAYESIPAGIKIIDINNEDADVTNNYYIVPIAGDIIVNKKEITITIIQDEKELTGDGVILDTYNKRKGYDVSFKNAQLSQEVMDIINGSTTTSSGTGSSKVYKTVDKSDDQPGYFALEFAPERSVGEKDYHRVLYKVSGTYQEEYAEEDYMVCSFTGKGVARTNDKNFGERKLYEAITDIAQIPVIQ